MGQLAPNKNKMLQCATVSDSDGAESEAELNAAQNQAPLSTLAVIVFKYGAVIIVRICTVPAGPYMAQPPPNMTFTVALQVTHQGHVWIDFSHFQWASPGIPLVLVRMRRIARRQLKRANQTCTEAPTL